MTKYSLEKQRFDEFTQHQMNCLINQREYRLNINTKTMSHHKLYFSQAWSKVLSGDFKDIRRWGTYHRCDYGEPLTFLITIWGLLSVPSFVQEIKLSTVFPKVVCRFSAKLKHFYETISIFHCNETCLQGYQNIPDIVPTFVQSVTT